MSKTYSSVVDETPVVRDQNVMNAIADLLSRFHPCVLGVGDFGKLMRSLFGSLKGMFKKNAVTMYALVRKLGAHIHPELIEEFLIALSYYNDFSELTTEDRDGTRHLRGVYHEAYLAGVESNRTYRDKNPEMVPFDELFPSLDAKNTDTPSSDVYVPPPATDEEEFPPLAGTSVVAPTVAPLAGTSVVTPTTRVETPPVHIETQPDLIEYPPVLIETQPELIENSSLTTVAPLAGTSVVAPTTVKRPSTVEYVLAAIDRRTVMLLIPSTPEWEERVYSAFVVQYYALMHINGGNPPMLLDVIKLTHTMLRM